MEILNSRYDLLLWQNILPPCTLTAGTPGSCNPWGVPEFGVTLLSIVIAALFVAFSLTATFLTFDVNPLSQAVGASCTGRVWQSILAWLIILQFFPCNKILNWSYWKITHENLSFKSSIDIYDGPAGLLVIGRWRPFGTYCERYVWCWAWCRSTSPRSSVLQWCSWSRPSWSTFTSKSSLSTATLRMLCAEEFMLLSRGQPLQGLRILLLYPRWVPWWREFVCGCGCVRLQVSAIMVRSHNNAFNAINEIVCCYEL